MELLFGKHIHSQLLLHAFIFGFYFFKYKLISESQFEKSLFRREQFVFGKCNRERANSKVVVRGSWTSCRDFVNRLSLSPSVLSGNEIESVRLAPDLFFMPPEPPSQRHERWRRPRWSRSPRRSGGEWTRTSRCVVNGRPIDHAPREGKDALLYHGSGDINFKSAVRPRGLKGLICHDGRGTLQETIWSVQFRVPLLSSIRVLRRLRKKVTYSSWYSSWFI